MPQSLFDATDSFASQPHRRGVFVLILRRSHDGAATDQAASAANTASAP